MWDWLDYGALIVGALAIFAEAVVLTVRVLQAVRSLKRFRRHVFRELDRLADKVETTADKLESVSDTETLDAGLGRLRISLAQLALLREAFDEALALVPRW
jgi:hypothetical protein